jgi:hypothetical protein
MEYFTRADLLTLLEDLGGHGDQAALQAADDAYLAAIVKNRIAGITDIDLLAALLLRKLPLEWRSSLMARYILLSARPLVSAPPKRTALTLRIPDGLSVSHHYGLGRVIQSRIDQDGRAVLDNMAPSELLGLMAGQHGKAWADCNGEAIRKLREFS